MRILSIDGGGIRGVLPGQILVSLEEKIQQKTGDSNARLGNYFDLVAGTSTGAILSAAYICPDQNNQPKFSAQEALDFYLEDGDEIFDVGLWRTIKSIGGLTDEKYSATELERVLYEAFGHTKLSELLKPTCFVSYDINRRRPTIFKQHTAIEKKRDFLVRELLRASAAAPTFFEAARIYSLPPLRQKYALIDGGVIANDPALCAYSEAITIEGDSSIDNMVILSLGTGKKLKRYTYHQVKDWGPLGWAKPTIDIALGGGPQMTEYYLKQMASTAEGIQYFRLQPNLYGADTDMDNATPENLEMLRDAGIRNAEDFDEQIDRIAELITASE